MKHFIKTDIYSKHYNMNTYEYQKLRGLKRKLHLINLRGGKCEKCGYCNNLAVLEFHHLDPTKKDSQLDMRSLSNSTMSWILKEFDKCQVLCSNCHRELHNEDLIIDRVLNTVKDLDESILKNKNEIKRPKCVDCGVSINYTYERCKICSSKTKISKNKPDLELLNEELKNATISHCARKYKVSTTTIRRWTKEFIKK